MSKKWTVSVMVYRSIECSKQSKCKQYNLVEKLKLVDVSNAIYKVELMDLDFSAKKQALLHFS